MSNMEKAKKVTAMYQEMIDDGAKIPCIKVIRHVTGCGIKEAKDLFEADMRRVYYHEVDDLLKALTYRTINDPAFYMMCLTDKEDILQQIDTLTAVIKGD